MTTVLEGKEGWHLFRLTGRRHAHSQEFKDVKEQIRHRIYRKQRRDTMKTYLEELRAKTTYSLDDAALESIKIAKPATLKNVPPATLGQVISDISMAVDTGTGTDTAKEDPDHHPG